MNYKIIYKDYDFYRSPFSISWEQCKLNQIADIIGGGTPSTQTSEFWDGDIDWYAPAEMEGKIYANGSERKITKLGLQKSSAKLLPAYKTILFTSRAGIGKMAILQRVGATNQGFQSLVLKDEYNPYFIYSMGSKIKTKAETIASGSTFLEISGRMLGNIEISCPKENEQIKISKYFNKLDNLITLHQCKDFYGFNKYVRKNTPLKSHKITTTWEQCKLGNIGSTFTGLSGKTSSDFGHGDASFITYMNVFTNPIADPNRVEPIEIDNCQRQVQYGDVFFTTSSETPDEVGMSSIWLENKANVYLNSFCFGYRLNINIDPYYFAYLLRSGVIRKPMRLLAQGISRFNISKNKVMEISASLPNLVEQRKIGTIMYKLDNLITLHLRL